jgi:hypothetical protein
MLDQKLLETFTRAMNWNAMVLLDDVDIYGNSQGGYNYKRSALLPTFLRHLEYSECLTFITMAFMKGGDFPLASRLHATVPFPRFNWKSQRAIWVKFIRRLSLDSDTEYYLIDFVEKELKGLDGGQHKNMNAWQIRNCIDVALTLSRKETPGSPRRSLQSKHIEIVLKLGEAFRAYALQERKETTQDNSAQLFNDGTDPLSHFRDGL